MITEPWGARSEHLRDVRPHAHRCQPCPAGCWPSISKALLSCRTSRLASEQQNPKKEVPQLRTSMPLQSSRRPPPPTLSHVGFQKCSVLWIWGHYPVSTFLCASHAVSPRRRLLLGGGQWSVQEWNRDSLADRGVHQGHNWVWKVRSDHSTWYGTGVLQDKRHRNGGLYTGRASSCSVQEKRTGVLPGRDWSERGVQNMERGEEQKGKILNQDVIKSCKCQVNFQSVILWIGRECTHP